MCSYRITLKGMILLINKEVNMISNTFQEAQCLLYFFLRGSISHVTRRYLDIQCRTKKKIHLI